MTPPHPETNHFPANSTGTAPRSVAAPTTAPAPGPTTAPTTAPAVRLDAGDADGLKAHLGKVVTVTGTVTRAELSQTRKVFRITFKEAGTSGFNAVIFDRNLRAFEEGFGKDLGAAMTGKTVEVTGKLEEYREKPQVVLREPAQLRVK